MENANQLNTTPELWQVDINGQIYEADLEEMAEWIAEGSLLPIDRVRRGNLRWLEANKIPVLHGFFNAKELGIEPPKISTVNSQNQPTFPTVNSSNTINQIPNNIQTFERQDNSNLNIQADSVKYCAIHPGLIAETVCETCVNFFCQECSRSFENLIKSCPLCGAICQSVKKTEQSALPKAVSSNYEPAGAQHFAEPKPDYQQQSFANPKNFQSAELNVNETGPQQTNWGVVILLLLGAVVISNFVGYTWAYLQQPDEEAEKRLPQVVTLTDKYNSEKETEEKRLAEELAAKKLQRAQVARVKEANKIPSGGGMGGCFDAMTREPVECSDLMKNNKDLFEKQNTYVPPTNPYDQTTESDPFVDRAALDMLDSKYRADRSKLIEVYRIDRRTKSYYLTTVLTLIFLLTAFGIRKLIYRNKRQPA